MESTNVRTVYTDDSEIIYFLERKSVKNLNLRVKKDGKVFVSVNASVPCKDVDTFVQSRSSYILNALNRFKEIAQYEPQPKQYVAGETFYIQGRGLRLQIMQSARNFVSSDGIYITLEVKDVNDYEKRKRLINRFLDQQCSITFGEVIDDLYPIFKKYGVGRPSLRIRNMETRWGSCQSKKGIITLNKRLLDAPRSCIEYVVMHEFCHFIHPNHSKRFYAFLSILMPDWKERKQFLDKSSAYWL